jgi:hypothetical protein
LVEHAISPSLTKAKGFSAARTAFRKENLAIDDDAQLPIDRPRQQRTTDEMAGPPHHPERADVSGCVGM